MIPNEKVRRTRRLKLNQWAATLLARTIRLEIQVSRPEPRSAGKAGRLILANHHSVLDLIALASLEECVFVTSQEMAETPVVGSLARMSGSEFVERRNRENREAELQTLANLLREGRTIILFPEATTGNGEALRRFRNGLLGAALQVPGVEIIPLYLQYETVGGRPLSAANRDRVFLPLELPIPRHLWRLFTNPKVRLHARYLPGFAAVECQTAQELAERAETAVRAWFRPILEAPMTF